MGVNWGVAVGEGLSKTIPAISQLETDAVNREAITQRIATDKSQQKVIELDVAAKEREVAHSNLTTNYKTWPIYLNAPPELQMFYDKQFKGVADDQGFITNFNKQKILEDSIKSKEIREEYKAAAALAYSTKATAAYKSAMNQPEGSAKRAEYLAEHEENNRMLAGINNKLVEYDKQVADIAHQKKVEETAKQTADAATARATTDAAQLEAQKPVWKAQAGAYGAQAGEHTANTKIINQMVEYNKANPNQVPLGKSGKGEKAPKQPEVISAVKSSMPFEPETSKELPPFYGKSLRGSPLEKYNSSVDRMAAYGLERENIKDRIGTRTRLDIDDSYFYEHDTRLNVELVPFTLPKSNRVISIPIPRRGSPLDPTKGSKDPKAYDSMVETMKLDVVKRMAGIK